MQYSFKNNLLFSLLAFAILISCEQDEGPGGAASVSGYLYTVELNKDQQVVRTRPGADQDVYLIYGDDAVYSDNMETQYDGFFRFEYLRAGNYSIYYYSDDTLAGSKNKETAFTHQVKLAGKETHQFDTLYTYKYVDFDDGSSSISGHIERINYYGSALPPFTESDIKDITPAQDEEVFLVYNNDSVYCESVHTNYNGVFRFNNLIAGPYRVYVYSEDLPGGIYAPGDPNTLFEPNSLGTFDIVVYRDITINDEGQHLNVGTIQIETD